MTITQTERANFLISMGKRTELSDEEIIADAVARWQISKKYRMMLLGQRYYENENDISLRRRMVIGDDARFAEDRLLTNNKIAHSFVRKIVDQKSQYLFGRPFTVTSGNEKFSALLNGLFDGALRRKIKNVCKEAVNKGVAWLQAYVEGGELRFMKIPSEQMIPLWEDLEKSRLGGLLRVYSVETYDGKMRKDVTHVEYWSKKGVRYYIFDNGEILPDGYGDTLPHLFIDGEGYNFERLPFIPFRYNEEELPLLQFIKALVDDYDLLKSDDSNAIMDTPNAIMVLKNYDGEDLGEFRRNLAEYKAVKVTDDGGLDIKKTDVSTDAIIKHLELDRKDIYETGRSVDTQSEKLGNASGVALKFLYADLDLDANGVETEFLSAFDRMVEFFRIVLKITGKGDFSGEDYGIVLNRDMIANESEAIDDCVSSSALLSEETVLANHPWVKDVKKEILLRKKEAQG